MRREAPVRFLGGRAWGTASGYPTADAQTLFNASHARPPKQHYPALPQKSPSRRSLTESALHWA